MSAKLHFFVNCKLCNLNNYYDLLITDQIYVVESDWSVEIQLKVTCARLFSCWALTLSSFGLARKRLDRLPGVIVGRPHSNAVHILPHRCLEVLPHPVHLLPLLLPRLSMSAKRKWLATVQKIGWRKYGERERSKGGKGRNRLRREIVLLDD